MRCKRPYKCWLDIKSGKTEKNDKINHAVYAVGLITVVAYPAWDLHYTPPEEIRSKCQIALSIKAQQGSCCLCKGGCTGVVTMMRKTWSVNKHGDCIMNIDILSQMPPVIFRIIIYSTSTSGSCAFISNRVQIKEVKIFSILIITVMNRDNQTSTFLHVGHPFLFHGTRSKQVMMLIAGLLR